MRRRVLLATLTAIGSGGGCLQFTDNQEANSSTNTSEAVSEVSATRTERPPGGSETSEESEETPKRQRTTAGVPMVQYNPARTGYAPNETAPTGSITPRWEFDAGGGPSPGLSSPTVADSAVYVGSQDRTVYAVSEADGTERWRFSTGGAIWESLAVVNDTVYVGG